MFLPNLLDITYISNYIDREAEENNMYFLLPLLQITLMKKIYVTPSMLFSLPNGRQ